MRRNSDKTAWNLHNILTRLQSPTCLCRGMRLGPDVPDTGLCRSVPSAWPPALVTGTSTPESGSESSRGCSPRRKEEKRVRSGSDGKQNKQKPETFHETWWTARLHGNTWNIVHLLPTVNVWVTLSQLPGTKITSYLWKLKSLNNLPSTSSGPERGPERGPASQT